MLLAVLALAAQAHAQVTAPGGGVWDFSRYPTMGQSAPVPVNPDFAKRYDISRISDTLDLKGNGAPVSAPDGVCPPTTNPQARCDWRCDTCNTPTDILDCGRPGVWGLSIDDGPSQFTPQLLDFLDARNVKATLCVTGSNVRENPDILLRAHKAGHEICIHSWSHWSLPTMPAEQILAELEWTRQIIEQVTGVSPRYYRPPYGELNNRVRAVAEAMGMKGAYLWNADGNDWKLTNNPSALDAEGGLSGIYAGFASAMGPNGTISLQHDIFEVAVKAGIAAMGAVLDKQVKVMSIAQCRGEADPYAGVKSTNSSAASGSSRSSAGIGPRAGMTWGAVALVSLAGALAALW